MSKQNSPHLTLITIDLSFHAAAAGVVHRLLNLHGVETSEIRVPHERAFELFRQGTGDLLCAAWLPGSHGDYLRPFEDEAEKLNVLYTPYALWGVPDYVPVSEVAELADLAKPEVAQRMIKRIQGIGPGAGISRFSREIVTRYGLDKLGYRFENGSLEECVAAFESAAAQEQWAVVPLWQPQYLHYQHHIRSLRDPEGLLRGRDEARILLRKSSRDILPPDALEALRRLQLGNETMTLLDHLTARERLTALEAAERIASANAA